MVNKKDLRGGAEKMREVAQLLCLWAEDLEEAAEKKSRKKMTEPVEEPAAEAAVPAEAVVAEADAPAEVIVSEAVQVKEAVAQVEIKYEDLRGLLAEKSAAGYRTQVIALINSFGAEKLSEVDPAHYADLWDAASGLGGDGDAG